MSKYMCEFGIRNEFDSIICTLNENQGCRYIRYCTQDSRYWCSDEYFKCERRKSEMGKKDRRNYNLREDQIEETKEIKKEETEQVIEDPIPETPIKEKIEEQEIKKESKPAVRSTLRRILY